MSDLLRIVVILLLVLGNAIFVAAEYALVTARRTRLQELVDSGRAGAGHALQLMDNPVRFISTVQVGITVAGIAMGAIGQPLVSHWFDFVQSTTVAFVIAFFFLTFLSVSLGELVPKAIALQRAERLAIALAWPIVLLGRVT
jgi:putative hemolysin